MFSVPQLTFLSLYLFIPDTPLLVRSSSDSALAPPISTTRTPSPHDIRNGSPQPVSATLWRVSAKLVDNLSFFFLPDIIFCCRSALMFFFLLKRGNEHRSAWTFVLPKKLYQTFNFLHVVQISRSKAAIFWHQSLIQREMRWKVFLKK